MVSGDGARPADLHRGPGADTLRADRALPRHPRHPVERPDAVVLLDADPVLDQGSAGLQQGRARYQPDDPRRGLVSGDPVLPGPDRPLEVAAGDRRACRCCCSSPASGSSTGCAIRSRNRCSDEDQETNHRDTEAQRTTSDPESAVFAERSRVAGRIAAIRPAERAETQTLNGPVVCVSVRSTGRIIGRHSRPTCDAQQLRVSVSLWFSFSCLSCLSCFSWLRGDPSRLAA